MKIIKVKKLNHYRLKSLISLLLAGVDIIKKDVKTVKYSLKCCGDNLTQIFLNGVRISRSCKNSTQKVFSANSDVRDRHTGAL